MVNDWTRRTWLLLFPLQAGLFIVLWVVPCHAALLKDIRIGEYEDFTRIVFEFNTQTGIDSIDKGLAGQLKITFPDMRTEFTRPIPAKHSERLLNYEVWQYKDRLSVVFEFSNDNLRFDSFQLKSPPRLVVDVYQKPLPLQAPGIPQHQIAQKPIAQSDSNASLANDLKTRQPPLPLDRLSLQHDAKPSIPADLDSAPSPRQSTVVKQSPAANPSTKQPVLIQQSIQPATETLNARAAADETLPEAKGGLQHYLLIALVILTIFILSLMVVMLFSRHKWTNGKKTIKLDDLLHRQDQHIAAINSQIEEHLKRYDEI